MAGQEPVRVQCAFVDTPEVEDIVDYIGEQTGFQTAYLLPDYVPEGGEASTSGAVDLSDRDPLFDEAARLIVIQQQGSTSLIQRKFAIGYNRAGRFDGSIGGCRYCLARLREVRPVKYWCKMSIRWSKY